MNKRTAKKIAWFHSALVVENAISSGWPRDSLWFEDQSNDDQDRILEAMDEVFREMISRGRERHFR